MNNINYKIKEELIIDINITSISNNFINNVENWNLNFYSKNYHKKSRGRKKFKDEHLNVLNKCYILFGENLTLAKIFLPDFNLNQIYNKFQTLKSNNYKEQNVFLSFIESFENLELVKNKKKKSDLSIFNLDNFVSNNKNHYKISKDNFPSIQNITEINGDELDNIKCFKFQENTNDSFKSINNFENNYQLNDAFKKNC